MCYFILLNFIHVLLHFFFFVFFPANIFFKEPCFCRYGIPANEEIHLKSTQAFLTSSILSLGKRFFFLVFLFLFCSTRPLITFARKVPLTSCIVWSHYQKCSFRNKPSSLTLLGPFHVLSCLALSYYSLCYFQNVFSFWLIFFRFR